MRRLRFVPHPIPIYCFGTIDKDITIQLERFKGEEIFNG